MKCQSLVIFSFHNQHKTEIFTINKPNVMIKSKHQQYFCCFIVCILISYAFWFSYLQNIVTILIIATFRGAALIREKALIRGRLLFQCGYPKVWCLLEGGHLFETRRLLEEIRYAKFTGQQGKRRLSLYDLPYLFGQCYDIYFQLQGVYLRNV